MGAGHKRVSFVAGLLLVPGLARGATYELTLEDAVHLAQQRSASARRVALQTRQSELVHRGARRGLWPELSLDAAVPEYSQQFAVVPLPSAPGDTVFTGGEPPRLIYAKSTTTSRNASSGLRYRQLLPWRGALTADGSVFYRDEQTTPEEARAARRDYTVSAAFGLEVPLVGDDPVRRELRRARIEWEQAQARARADRAQVEFETVSSYLALLRAGLALDVVRDETEQSTQAYEVAKRKVAAGLLADVDRLKMEVYRVQREARLGEAAAQLDRARDEFKLDLGLALDDSLVLVEKLQPFTLQEPAAVWLERALEQRTELGLLQRDIDLLEQDRAARRPYRPDVELAVRYGGAASEAALDQALQSLSANDLSLRLGVHVPLWDAGRLALADDAQRTGIALRELELETTRTRIELEVRDALRQMQDAAHRHDILAASTELASELLRISSERYERGLIDTQTYLSAQADAATAQLESTSALLDLYQARARLRLVSMDGEW